MLSQDYILLLPPQTPRHLSKSVVDMELQLVTKAGTTVWRTGWRSAFGWPVEGQRNGQCDRHCAVVILPHSHRLQEEPAAARQEGACHKRTVWLKRSGVLWINWILLTALLTCCILTGLGGDYRELEQISIYRSTQILGFNKKYTVIKAHSGSNSALTYTRCNLIDIRGLKSNFYNLKQSEISLVHRLTRPK